jgi:hypothetical protein
MFWECQSCAARESSYVEWSAEDTFMPSWSWVKLRESLSFLCDGEKYSRTDEDTVYIQSDICLQNSNPYGSISAGIITINAFVQDIDLDWCDGNSHDVVEIAVQNSGELQVVGTARLDCDYENDSLPSPCVAAEILASSSHGTCFLVLQRNHDHSDSWKRVGVGWTNLTRWSNYFIGSTTRRDVQIT